MFRAGLLCLAAAIPLLAPLGSAIAAQYLCIPDKSVGFRYNKATKTWDDVHFRTDMHYVMAPAQPGSTPADRVYSWTQVGKPYPDAYCTEFNGAGISRCDLFGGDVYINRSNGRYLMSFFLGYYNVGIPGPMSETDETSSTPALEIGKCSPF